MIPHEAQCASPSANPVGGRSRFDPSAIPRNDHVHPGRHGSGGDARFSPARRPPARPPCQQVIVGGQEFGAPNAADVQTVPGTKAKLLPNGEAAAPADARPRSSRRSGPRTDRRHALPLRRRAPALRGLGLRLLGHRLLRAPRRRPARHAEGLQRLHELGRAGKGSWITVYTNPGHAYTVIAGLRLDTSAAGDPNGGKGPRWRPTLRSTAASAPVTSSVSRPVSGARLGVGSGHRLRLPHTAPRRHPDRPLRATRMSRVEARAPRARRQRLRHERLCRRRAGERGHRAHDELPARRGARGHQELYLVLGGSRPFTGR